jgi:hypothetical protein
MYNDTARATGKFKVECFDPQGNLKWSTEDSNLVVNTGLAQMANSALAGSTQVTQWYVGLYGPQATNNPAATDTAALHPGWTEITPYANSTRPQAVFVAGAAANPTVVTNAASPASFLINATATVGGAFIISNNTKGGTAGTLFSAADFTTADRSVALGDILNVTYTFSLAG